MYYEKKNLLKKLVSSGASTKQMVEELDISSRTVRRWKIKLAKEGFSPDHNMTHDVPEGFEVKGVSTYYGKDGEVVGQWVKSTQEHSDILSKIKETIDSWIEGIPRVKSKKFDVDVANDLMAVYPLGDPHIGMYASKENYGS